MIEGRETALKMKFIKENVFASSYIPSFIYTELQTCHIYQNFYMVADFL